MTTPLFAPNIRYLSVSVYTAYKYIIGLCDEWFYDSPVLPLFWLDVPRGTWDNATMHLQCVPRGTYDIQMRR